MQTPLEANNMYSEREESVIYSSLRQHLRVDLTSTFGFPDPVAGEILNLFDPANEEYLTNVDDWQRGLCSQGGSTEFREAVIRHQAQELGFSTLFGVNMAECLGAIHQVAKLMYKFHGEVRKETDWDEVKNRLRNPGRVTLGPSKIRRLREILKPFHIPDNLDELLGRFGPGATSEKLDAYLKWARRGYIPCGMPPSFFRVNSRDPWVPSGFDSEGITRISEVPKSIKTNRVVSSEPAMRMFCQLAIADELDKQVHKVFAGHVWLHDQDRHSSNLFLPGACSVDLKDASDHICAELVAEVLPQLWPVLAQVRSQQAQFPDGEIVPLRTFAPMGCGLTFVVMTIVILGLMKLALEDAFIYDVDEETARYWARHRNDVFFATYGDDGIVHKFMYPRFCTYLAQAGMVQNTAKSCSNGVYVEACGRELLNHVDITPVYIRDPLNKLDAAAVENICASLDARGFRDTAAQVYKLADVCKYICWNKDLQRQEVCVRTISARAKVRSLAGWDGLLRWFLVGSQQELTHNGLKPKDQQGVAREVWTKPAWRQKPVWDYPYIAARFVTEHPKWGKTTEMLPL